MDVMPSCRGRIVSAPTENYAEKIYQTLLEAGVEVLYDDRDVSPGVKFADSDLIGIPYRVIVSEKTLAQESVEVKKRNEAESKLVKIEGLAKYFSSQNPKTPKPQNPMI